MKRHLRSHGLLVLAFGLLATSGCVRNIKLDYPTQPAVGVQKTGLVAGWRPLADVRPKDDTEEDDIYARPVPDSVTDLVIRDLEATGLFAEVQRPPFATGEVDVLLQANLKRMAWEETFEAWTIPVIFFALSGLPCLVYLLAGGPSGGAEAHADIELVVMSRDGDELARVSGAKYLHRSTGLYSGKEYGHAGPGGMEAEALGEAVHQAIEDLAVEIRVAQSLGKIPRRGRMQRSGGCGSDRDCKGRRVCKEGDCVSPR